MAETGFSSQGCFANYSDGGTDGGIDVGDAVHGWEGNGIKMPLSTPLPKRWHYDGVALPETDRPNRPMQSPTRPPSTSDQRRQALQSFIDQRKRNTPKWSITDWARRANVPRNIINNFLNHRSNTITVESMEKLARAEGVASSVLLGETGHVARSMKDVATIRCLEVRASAGGGFDVLEEPDGAPFYLRKDLAERLFGGDENNLRVITFQGDSMLPTIRDGDLGIVRIRTSSEEFRPGKIYVLWDGRGLVVKRVETVITSRPRYRIISDNSALYASYEVDEMEAYIVGPVIWRGGAV